MKLLAAANTAALFAALLIGFSRDALAQPSPEEASPDSNRERAVELYREGTRLLNARKYSEAAAQFEQSLALLQGRGTLLNLAICHENLGDLATAWREFEAVRRDAEQANDAARYDAAREHLDWIEPQLSFLTVTPAGVTPPGLIVELNGVPGVELDVMQPVPPGRHRVRATAPGKAEWTADVVVTRAGERTHVTVPTLEDLQPPKPAEVSASPAHSAQPPVPTRVKVSHTRPSAPDLSPIYIAGAATAVLASGSVLSSVLYYERRNEYHRATSRADKVSDEEVHARRSSAVQMDWINRVLITGTAVGAGVTGYFVYRALTTKHSAPTTAWVTPWVSPSSAGVQGALRF